MLTTTTCLGANGKIPSVDEWFPKEDDVLRISKNENSTNINWLFVDEAIDGIKEIVCEMIIFVFISKVIIDVITCFSKRTVDYIST